jgi:drug/metabolite transporter (DMT)-like permease
VKYLSRKFIIASLFSVTGCAVFAFTGKLTGGEFVGLALGLTGAFTAGDVALNAIHKKNAE